MLLSMEDNFCPSIEWSRVNAFGSLLPPTVVLPPCSCPRNIEMAYFHLYSSAFGDRLVVYEAGDGIDRSEPFAKVMHQEAHEFKEGSMVCWFRDQKINLGVMEDKGGVATRYGGELTERQFVLMKMKYTFESIP
jgi:hypothetical protein